MTPHYPKIKREVLWFYGVLVGLALKEALVPVISHYIDPPRNTVRTEHFQEFWRLLIFVLLAVRFYLGAVIYFSDVYDSTKYPTKSFGTDFLVGFVHFVLFFGLALTIPIHNPSDPSLSQDGFRTGLFLGLLLVVLLYDLLWLVLNRKNSTKENIAKWAYLNLFTVIAMMFVYVIVFVVYTVSGSPFDFFTCEAIVLIPLLIASIVDIPELVDGKPVIGNIIKGITGWLHEKFVKKDDGNGDTKTDNSPEAN